MLTNEHGMAKRQPFQTTQKRLWRPASSTWHEPSPLSPSRSTNTAGKNSQSMTLLELTFNAKASNNQSGETASATCSKPYPQGIAQECRCCPSVRGTRCMFFRRCLVAPAQATHESKTESWRKFPKRSGDRTLL